jgi:CheY-like chemotaxis protein
MREHLQQTKALTQTENLDAIHRTAQIDFPAEVPTPPPQIRQFFRLKSGTSGPPRILLVTDDDLLAETVRQILISDRFVTVRARSLAEALEATYSGQFPVAIATARLEDGSWKRLAAVADRARTRFSVIVLAKTFGLHEWAEALDDGAFEVLDAISELPKLAEVVRHALLTEYLLGERPDLEILGFWRPS